MAQLNNVAGDGGLSVDVSSTGAFGSSTGATGASDAQYDPIGTRGVGATTYQSDIAFRIGSTGARQFLSSLATNVLDGSGTSTAANSSFIASGLNFELVQAVDNLNQAGIRTGSSLSQTYKITNPTSQTISFELVRYFDGDLLFDGSLLDTGGKITRSGQDILFETDSGDSASAPTTFVGITAKGGTNIASNRLEIGEFSSLRSRILAGDPLSNLIQGDINGDSFIDGAAYDVTPAFRNVFELAAGQSTTYVTETIFGSGAPNQVVLPQVVTVVATDAIAAENPIDPAIFTFTRTNSDLAQALTVNYALTGTAGNGADYTNLANSVTFAAGQATTTVTVTPIDDIIVEPTESVILTLANGTGYNLAADLTQAQINITDNDNLPVITISSGVNAAEPATNGTFTLTRTGDLAAALTVNLAIPTGTATSGTDYTALATTATFAAGSATATVNVAPIDDTIIEPTETISLALAAGTGYTLGAATAATIDLTDNDVALPIITISSGVSAAEPATNGTFILTRTGDLAAALTVNLAVPTGTATSGTDYTALATTATFAVGSATATVNVATIDDTIVEPTETISLALAAGTGYTLGATTAASINLTDNDVAAIVLPSITIASGIDAAEPATNGSFTLTRTGDLAAALTVNLAASTGSATSGVDYAAFAPTVTFAAGSATATVNVLTIDDLLVEPTETVGLVLAAGTGYTLGAVPNAPIDLNDNDVAAIVLPIVTIASGIDAAEPATNGSFTLTRTGDLAAALTVNLAASTGSATSGVDYTAFAPTATFAVGSATATVNVLTIDDLLVEPTETVGLVLAAGTGYTLGAVPNAPIDLNDNDVAVAPPQLEEQNNHCLHIKGGGDKSVLKFTKSKHHGKNKNQVCAFVVDDATGKIAGINPGHKDYLAAAIDRAQVVFSSLSDSPTDSGFDRDSQRHLNFKSGEHVEFMMIADDTLSRVKTDLAANKTPTNVLFSIPEANGNSSSPAKFTALLDGGYQIDWEDGSSETTDTMPDFNDMVMRVQVLNDPKTPAGIDIQNQSQGSVMDFRSSATNLKVDIKCESDAAYNNNIGFYAVEDTQGTLANGLKPGDAGYAEAAIKGALLRCFKTDVKTDLALEGGKIYAPVVIANGTFEDYLKTNPQNQASGDIHAYFNFIGANTDNVDHFRLLGDNKFGVEDFYGGGDKDYNDIVFQMNVKG
jgi:Calx-beta domain/Domain of unknown function (DUF4114)